MQNHCKFRHTIQTSCMFLSLLMSFTTVSAAEVRAAFSQSCPTAKQIPSINQALDPITGTILVALTGKLIDAGFTAAKKMVAPDAMTLKGSFLQNGLFIYRGNAENSEPARVLFNPELSCLVIAVGDFSSKKEDWVLPFESELGGEYPKTHIKRMFPTLSNAPDMYFEAQLVQSPDGSAITWKPVRAYVGKYLNNNIFAGFSRGIQVSFNFVQPGADKAFFSQEISFNKVKKPFNLLSNDLENTGQGSWGKLVAPSDIKNKSGSVIMPSPIGEKFDPFTLNVAISESPKPYKLATLFVESVEAGSGAIKTRIGQELDSDKADQAKFTSQGTTLEALTVLSAAWKSAYDACDSVVTNKGPREIADCKIATSKYQLSKNKAEYACSLETVASCSTINDLTESKIVH